jgi:hypothetical protein
VAQPFSKAEAERRFDLLTYKQATDLKFKFVREETRVLKPDGSLLAMLIKDILDSELVAEAYKVLRKVKGDPSNRPEIFGKGTRGNRRREDGYLSPRVATGKEFVRAWPKAEANLLGGYCYKNSKPGVPKCRLTSWTRKRPDVAAIGLKLALAVDEVYREFAPEHYARQAEYVQTIPKALRLLGTNFSTMYVIKDKPTAVHRDKFDIPTGTGVMTTLGEFVGGELCFPQYRVAIDYQPGDVLIADVHELHGNLPVVSGERVAEVFFVRKGMHKCPDPLTV